MSEIRRRIFLLGTGGAIAAPWALLGCGDSDPKTPLSYEPAELQADLYVNLPPTPQCAEPPADATLQEIEGPYYKPQTPRRLKVFEGKPPGAPLRIVGRVLTPQCEPIPGAVLDFWQADPTGVYDTEGFGLRGHQFSDSKGAYALGTVKPGSYRDTFLTRTPHIHVKLQGPGMKLLTTQLYFPDESELNADDRFFHEELLLEPRRSDGHVQEWRFDFVLEPKPEEQAR